MTPQHFQQQAMWEQFSDERIARIASPDPWGIVRVELDELALGVDRLQLSGVQARLPDGTIIDTRVSDVLPSARSLNGIAAEHGTVEILLALPLRNGLGENCMESGEKTARPRRFLREHLPVADSNGVGTEEISVERNSLFLLFGFEPHGDYVSCPVARIVRNPQGRFQLDTAFVPPCLFISASRPLMDLAMRLNDVLAAKSASLAVRRRERSDQIADYAVADVSLFWLLHSVNSTWPELARLCAAPNQHPERLYGLLARLAGALLTFSTTASLASIPAYDHPAPAATFKKLEDLIRTLLDTVLPSRVVPIALEHGKATAWHGKINEERLLEADFYLAVRAALPAHMLLEQLPRLCKAGAPDEVEEILSSALPGIPLHAMSRLPAAIPVRIENQYFALDRSHPAFKRMLAARACRFYIPTSLPEVSLELYAVLPS